MVSPPLSCDSDSLALTVGTDGLQFAGKLFRSVFLGSHRPIVAEYPPSSKPCGVQS